MEFVLQAVAEAVAELFEIVRGGVFGVLDVDGIGEGVGGEVEIGGGRFGQLRPIEDETGLEYEDISFFFRERKESERGAGREFDGFAAKEEAEGEPLDAEEVFAGDGFVPRIPCRDTLVAGEADRFFPHQALDDGGEFAEEEVLENGLSSPKISSL